MISPSFSKRTKGGPSADEWTSQRPLIERLYIKETRPLSEIASILARSHNFIATTRMYKTRLGKWGLRKNYKAAEKDSIARRIEHCRKHRQPLPNLELLGQPVKLNRIHRFVREAHYALKRTCATSCSEQQLRWTPPCSPDLPVASQIDVTHERARPSLQGAKYIQHTNSTDKAMALTLFELRKYLTCDPIPSSSGLRSSGDSKTIDAHKIHDFGFSLLDGLRSLMAGKVNQACKYFNTGCDMADEIIKKQPRSMFDILFAAFLNAAWAPFEAIRKHLLIFLYKMSTLLLGSGHSLSIILSTILRHTIDTFLLPLFFQQMIDTLEEVCKQPSTALFQLKRNFISHVRISGDYESAEAMIRRELSTSWNAPCDAETLEHITMVRLLLARSRLDQGYHHEARALCEEILAKDQRSQMHSSAWQDSSIYAAGHLGVLDVLHGNISNGEIRLRRCLDAAVPRFGVYELDTVANYQWLEMASRSQMQRECKVIEDPFQWSGIDWTA